MRHHLFALLTIALAATSRAADLTLVAEGHSPYVIVLAANPMPAEQRGADELRSHLKQMTGVELPVVNDPDALPDHAILLGRSRHTDALGINIDAKALGLEGFALKTVGDHLVIAGPGSRGTMYACSELLEKVGVRWFTPQITRVPKRKTITLPRLDETQIPAFEYREPYFTEAQDKNWAARLRMNGSMAALDESTGGKVEYHHFVHTFDDLIPRALYAQHPEYFPLIKGNRTDGYVQRCLSNPDVLKLTIAQVKRWIGEAPAARIYSVSQNDTYNFCECDACKAIEARYGGAHSGLYLWFVNQVAEEIEKEHADKLIDTLAYQFTEEPPQNIVPRKNVRVRLCPIACCEMHPYESCHHPANVAFLDHLKRWSAITDTLYIWHYNTNFANYLMPFPDFAEFPAETRLYHRSGVKGIFFQGAYAPGGGGSDAELRFYVMAKLLWNEKSDADALVTEWMQGVYGRAAPPMRRWFDLLHEKVRNPNKHVMIYAKVDAYYLSDDVLAEGERLFDEAERLAAADPVATRAIAKSRLCLRYVRVARSNDTGPAFQSLVADLRKFGVTQVSEGRTVDQWEQQMSKAKSNPKP